MLLGRVEGLLSMKSSDRYEYLLAERSDLLQRVPEEVPR